MSSNTYAFKNIGWVPSVQNTKWSHTRWGMQYTHSEIKKKIARCAALRNSSHVEVTYERRMGEDIQAELQDGRRRKHIVIRD